MPAADAAPSAARRPAGLVPADAGRFLVRLLVLSAPFWVAGWLLDWSDRIPIRLPLSALQFLVVPVAALMVWRRSGGVASALLRRSLDVYRIPGVTMRIAVFALMPALVAVTYLLTSARDSTRAAATPLAVLPLFFALYWFSATCEAIGWTAVMTDALLPAMSPWLVGAMTGAAWAAWHAVPFLQTGNAATWILAQWAFSIVFRMLMTRVYTMTDRSMFAVIALQATYDTSFSMVPFYGSGYDPAGLTVVTLLALIVIAASDRRHLSGFRTS
ncbi:type II CAAX prenyl endopeptidase Rce1 family protein [Agromyces sp. GXQ0307]|uniref:CPBP family glutamic-type intramembrane protease n=1 Tax=Agromyces sp. GXQ0307 TaxID=3377835 RepID=UPI00383BE888